VKHLLIGEVARRAGVGIGAVRLYERLGLIPRPQRSAAGYRRYPGDTVMRLRFIRTAQSLGFTVKELAPLFSAPKTLAARMAKGALFDDKLREVEAKLQALELMRTLLLRLKAALSETANPDGCVLYQTAMELMREVEGKGAE